MRFITLIAAGLILAGVTAARASDRERGRDLVAANCARCHATGTADASSHPEAPPFRSLSQRYALETLEEALAEGISTGHPDMLEFTATPSQIDAILDYLGSLQER